MFGPRYRRPPFTDPLNWTDYRWDTGPWRGVRVAARGVPFGGPRRRSGLLTVLLGGLAVLVGARLFTSLQSRDGSWARRALYAVLLLLIARAIQQHRRRW